MTFWSDQENFERLKVQDQKYSEPKVEPTNGNFVSPKVCQKYRNWLPKS